MIVVGIKMSSGAETGASDTLVKTIRNRIGRICGWDETPSQT